MNTSVEQLWATYASCYLQDFADSVHLVVKHFMVALDENSDDVYEDDESRWLGLGSKETFCGTYSDELESKDSGDEDEAVDVEDGQDCGGEKNESV